MAEEKKVVRRYRTITLTGDELISLLREHFGFTIPPKVVVYTKGGRYRYDVGADAGITLSEVIEETE